MVLEALLGAKEAEKRPYYVFLLGMLYASVAVFLSLWIFRSEASLILVFLMVFASLPLIYKTTNFEAKKSYKLSEDKLPRAHIDALKVFLYLFMGFTIAMAIWYIALPSDITYDLFSSQISTINSINNNSATGNVTAWNFLSIIILNNLKVLVLCLLFSFFFGAGAIFILAWNASVISTALGNFMRTSLSEYASTIGLVKVGIYFQVFSLALIRYMTHGIFEILAYLIGGLAGGLISIAIINKHFEGDHFRIIIKDVVDLMILAVLLVVIAGLIEVFITPMFF
ncbi:MAG: stage II sporulation protein M [bacterium]|nr:stage II sporulation protein M [bacterium]